MNPILFHHCIKSSLPLKSLWQRIGKLGDISWYKKRASKDRYYFWLGLILDQDHHKLVSEGWRDNWDNRPPKTCKYSMEAVKFLNVGWFIEWNLPFSVCYKQHNLNNNKTEQTPLNNNILPITNEVFYILHIHSIYSIRKL